MQVQINYGDVPQSAALSEHLTDAIRRDLKHVESRITRIEVHLRDDKQRRRGLDDQRCMIEARIAGKPPIAVECRGKDIYEVATEAARKLARAVTHKLERIRS